MPLVVLDDAVSGRVSVFGTPDRVIAADDVAALPGALAALEEARQRGLHLAGYASYELGLLLEDRLRHLCPPDRSVPLLWFGVFANGPAVLDGAEAERFWARFCSGNARAYAGPLATEWTKDDYRTRFDKVQDYIRAGDIFQANLTLQGRFRFAGNPRAFYAALRPHGGGARGAYIEDGVRQVLSVSPELFVAVDADGTMRTEPMKGTAARGPTPGKDAEQRRALAASEKDRAENLMIVDLIRNDLGRIAVPGSVSVDALFAVETLPTVHQMVSRVSARQVPGTGIEAMLRALFPCGSITGAPKIRAMEIIADLESGPRGVYCGAIGHLAPDGSACFSVAIRTITLQDGNGTLGVGGGVTIDSTAAGEWAECRLKSGYFERARRPLSLIETMLIHDGTPVRRDLHLRRMAGSARVLGLPFDRTAAERTLLDATINTHGPRRLRLVLEENGRFVATSDAFEPGTGQTWRFDLSPVRLDSSDALLRHKTSWRDVYDTEWARAAAQGYDEVLFLNEKNELCEGSRTNLFVQKGDRLLTPALSCGLLDGCLRRALLDEGRAIEAILFPSDLEQTDRILLGNSLRGLVPAVRWAGHVG